MSREPIIEGEGPASPLEAAAIWRMRMASPDWSPSGEAAFEAWLAQDDLHRRAFERTGKVWDLVDNHAATPDVMVIRRDALHRAQKTARGRMTRWVQPTGRRAAIAAAVAGVLVVAGIGAAPLLSADEVYRTGLNERRVVTLSDGSKLSLDALTKVTVEYSDDARRLKLVSGQARFDVAHDVSRPFSVQARDRTVVATGTAFNIDVFEREARVTLIEGRVIVLAQPASPLARITRESPARPIAMQAGQQLVAPDHAPAQLVASVDLEQATAWQQGKLMFDKEPLAEAVVRMNRYSERKIVIGDVEAGAMPISGAFDAGNTRGFLEAVTAYLPVTATDGPGGVTLRSASPQG
jgi:transmembrane sensor